MEYTSQNQNQIGHWLALLFRTMPHSNAQENLDDTALKLKIEIYMKSFSKHGYPLDFFTEDTIVEVAENYKFFPELKELIDFFNPKFKRFREKQQLRLANENDAQRFRFARTIEEANKRVEGYSTEAKLCYEWWVKARVDEGWSNQEALRKMSWIISCHRDLEKLFYPWVVDFGKRPEDYLRSARDLEVQREKRMHTPQERDQIIQSIKAKYSFRAP